MSITVDAVYEDGVLKPKGPLPLAEHQEVRLTIYDPNAPNSSPVHSTYGLIGGCNDAETIRRIALEPEFGIEDSP